MIINCVWEHNGNDTLLYAVDYVGAYTRGENLEAAIAKMPAEIRSYLLWIGDPIPEEEPEIVIVQEKESALQISDADSDVLFDAEKRLLTKEEYDRLKALALRSASDFLELYNSVKNKTEYAKQERTTFYGAVPRTAKEMMEHTKSVNEYYFGEIEVDADNQGTVLSCRQRGFKNLEIKHDLLMNTVFEGSYGEEWSIRKVIRRFIWHDRIHAKAMWRLAKSLGEKNVKNPFFFE